MRPVSSFWLVEEVMAVGVVKLAVVSYSMAHSVAEAFPSQLRVAL